MNRLIVVSLLLFLNLSTWAQETVKLPAPEVNTASKMTLMQSLQQRHSQRAFSNKTLSDQTLSTLLWAACGYNRPEEKRLTAPSATNAQDITVFVCRADGAYRYDPAQNALIKVSSEDLRTAVAGRQAFAKDAPVSLVLVSDITKFRNKSREYAAFDAGFVSENICLACTAMGLATVPRATMDKGALAKALNLVEDQLLLLNNPVGYEK